MEKYELEIKNLNLSIGNNSILENINLKIKKGEIHCLIGPNGGGKSSLIKCILKELNFQGDITFQDNHKNIIGYLLGYDDLQQCASNDIYSRSISLNRIHTRPAEIGRAHV